MNAGHEAIQQCRAILADPDHKTSPTAQTLAAAWQRMGHDEQSALLTLAGVQGDHWKYRQWWRLSPTQRAAIVVAMSRLRDRLNEVTSAVMAAKSAAMAAINEAAQDARHPHTDKSQMVA